MVESPLERFPALAREIGPVVAASRRLASRYANALRVGHAAAADELADCRLILIQSPEAELPETLEFLLSSNVAWRGRPVALLHDVLGASALEPLSQRCAPVCSATFTPLPKRPLMAVEGDAAAVSAASAWATSAGIKSVTLRAGAKPLYTAGLMAAGSLVTPVVDSAARCLRACGFSPRQARQVLGHVVEAAIRAHYAHGRKAWPNPSGQEKALEAQLEALESVDSALALFHRRALLASLDFFTGATRKGAGAS